MDHEQAFRQAIREEPDDDAHRLIYADWLEEQGGANCGARAAFIRAQCRLATLPDDDPLRDALEDEAADLLAVYEDEWTQPLHGIAQDWRFARGFVEHVTLRGEDFLTHGERLFAFTPLRAVHLLIGVKDVPQLAACPHLQWLEALDFRRCFLNDRSLQQLLASPYLGRLTALQLGGNGINTPGMQSLVHSTVLPRLTRLDLSGNHGIGDKSVLVLAQASAAKNLRTLSLAHTSITVHGLRELFLSLNLSGLENLNVAGTRLVYPPGASPLSILTESKLLGRLLSLDLSESAAPWGLPFLLAAPQVGRLQALYLRAIAADGESAELLANSSCLANLTLLDLGKNNLGAEGAKTLANSPYFGSLTHLNVGFNNIRDTGAKAIAESPHLTRLRVLDLARNDIGGPGLKALAESANFGYLTALNLAGNFIGADSVQALTSTPHLRRLSHLDLSDAHLDRESARALAASASLERLTTLHLQKNQFSDAGARALAQSPYLKRLRTLDLNDNHIGKAGAEALAATQSWRRLRKLNLRGNIFTDTQETLLRQRFGSALLL